MPADLSSSDTEWIPPLFSLDTPAFPIGAGLTLHVSGWVAGNAQIGDIWVETEGPTKKIPVSRVDRPDVARVYPHIRNVSGFAVNVDTRSLSARKITVGYEYEGKMLGYTRSFDAEISPERKRAKLDRIAQIIRPGATWTDRGTHLDFMTTAAWERANLQATDVISSNGYDAYALGLFSYLHDGLILDAGAGFNPDYRDNVVNLEVVPYPTCDVLAIGEELPFSDNTFDAVISLAVLEHVRDPFTCAHEISRVLKPGGVLIAVVPFLQPFHGYPNHYYNMTSEGLRNLFAAMKPLHQGVPLSGLPIWSLCWFLKLYCEGLPADVREKFCAMSIGQFLESPATFLESPIVQSLPGSVNSTLASTTILLAKK